MNQYILVKNTTAKKTLAKFPQVFIINLDNVYGSIPDFPDRLDQDQVSIADHNSAKALKTPMAI